MVNFFTTIIGVAAFFQSRPTDHAKIDNSAFRLHYDYTTGIMFLSTTLLGLSEFWGKAIMCHSNVELYS